MSLSKTTISYFNIPNKILFKNKTQKILKLGKNVHKFDSLNQSVKHLIKYVPLFKLSTEV